MTSTTTNNRTDPFDDPAAVIRWLSGVMTPQQLDALRIELNERVAAYISPLGDC